LHDPSPGRRRPPMGNYSAASSGIRRAVGGQGDLCSRMTTDETCDVIVIGAGAAGLAAARRIAAAGRTVVVLEARERAGGRILTRHDPQSPIPIELGAEFIHGRPATTFDLLRDLRIPAVD